MSRTTLKLLPLVSIIFLAACATTPHGAISGGGIVHERNQGYSLLYELMGNESNVSKLLIFKSADEPLKSVIKEISNAASAAKKQMEDFAKQDQQLAYATPDLPYIEQRGRDLQAKDDEKALLFTSGKEFEVRLIFTQAQAMNYAMQLCR